MEQKKRTLLNQSTFFAALFALAIIGSYLVVNGPGLVLQLRYAAGRLPDSRPTNAPISLEIPKIGVRAPIILAEESEKDNLSPRLLDGVVHYPGTALPGEAGNGVYVGHSSNYWWQKSDFNNVFALAEKLETGDLVIIKNQNTTWTYNVTDTQTSPKDAADIFSEGDGTTETLTLVTCWPNGTDFKRLLVKAQLEK